MPDILASRRSVLAGATSLVAAGLVPARALAQGAFTLRDVLSYPFPSNLIPAPAGGAVAWVFNERGARNVWVATPDARGGYVSRRLTAFTDDDGQDTKQVVWDSTGRTLFYTRNGYGGGTGASGGMGRVEPNNSLSLPEGAPPIEIWSVGIDGSAPRRIAAGQAPAPSPRGDIVAFLRDDQIWTVAADGSAPPTQLIRDRERSDSLTWSPDGTKLAFVSTRRAHRIIGVYAFESRRIQWISPTIDQDGEPRWSPDGKRLAFIRQPFTPPGGMTGARREGYPWSIHVADPQTGAATEVFAASPGIGSVFQALVEGDNLVWAGDRLVFPWQPTGWIRLYAIPSGGGDPIALTPDKADVFTVNVTRDSKSVVYGSNAGNLDSRHIFQVAVDGRGAPRQLTRGEGIEDRPIIASDGRVVGLKADGRRSLMPFSLDERGRMTDLAPQAVPASFPADKLVVPELVSYRATDGLEVRAQLFLPPGKSTARKPAVLFFHGGPRNRQMFAAWDPFETHSHLYAANQYLASRGYIVLSVNFRGGTGYGFELREHPTYGYGGASEVNDILGSIDYIMSRPDVDVDRIGAWGGSYGGRMVSLAAVRAPDVFKVIVDYEGAHGAMNKTANPVAFASTAYADLDKWRAPVLFMTGDGGVGLDYTTDLAMALRRKGDVVVENFVVPDEVHFLMRKASWERIFAATSDFLDRYLMTARR